MKIRMIQQLKDILFAVGQSGQMVYRKDHRDIKAVLNLASKTKLALVDQGDSVIATLTGNGRADYVAICAEKDAEFEARQKAQREKGDPIPPEVGT